MNIVKIPYRLLLVAVAITAGVLLLLPTVESSSPSEEQSSNEQLIVVERMEDSKLFYINRPYVFDDDTVLLGLSREDINVGVWLLVTSEGKGRLQTLKTVKPAPVDRLELTGTVGSLLRDESGVIGFALNNMSILLPPGEEHAAGEGDGEHEIAIGMGVKVVAQRIENSTILQAVDIKVLRHHDLIHAMTVLMLQISIILLVAKIGGEIFESVLKQPGVLGELIAGMVISPYALGGMINIPGIGPLFETVSLSSVLKASPIQPDFAVSPELWAIAQMAAIILLFMAGLETDLTRFLKYAGPAAVIGMGGVVAPFFLGAWATMLFIPAVDSLWHPTAMFMGAIMVATSVGITARVLSDINRLDTSEGVTILAGAVIDDVIGILVLAIVNAIALAELAGTQIDVDLIVGIALKAILFWLGLTGIGILASRSIQKFMLWFKSKGATFGIGLSICFASAATAELFGLAMIIGAYSIGLALSDRRVAHYLEEALSGVYSFIVPIFFTVMGMLVDFNQMMPLFWPYGVVISLFAVVSKVFGCGIPALFVGFNLRGAYRIGLGMLPRGEVALIIAGVGIANGILATDMFGVAILITMVTTLLSPPLLVPAFKKGGHGTHEEVQSKKEPQAAAAFFTIECLSRNQQAMMKDVIVDALREAGYQRAFSDPSIGIFEVLKNGVPVVIRLSDEKYEISLDSPKEVHGEVRNILIGVADYMEEYRVRIQKEISAIKPA